MKFSRIKYLFIFRFLKISEDGKKPENLERKKLKLNSEIKPLVENEKYEKEFDIQKLDSLFNYSSFPYRQ